MNAGPVWEARVWQLWQNMTYVSLPRPAWAALYTPLKVVRAVVSGGDPDVWAAIAPVAGNTAASTQSARKI